MTIDFNNKDSVPLNLSIYEDAAGTRPVFIGENVTGPATIQYQFVAPQEPGDYFFRCDSYPTTMTGSFIVQGTAS